uniref:c-type cytochrome n=1 Tax=Pararhizobium sp. IMCC3301 TaxID=3067904 RepID=UPI00274276BA|nr:cytochrome c [Pararhizobium sp. IMCC3301]
MNRKAIFLAGAAAAALVTMAALAQQPGDEAGAEGVTFLGEPVSVAEIANGQRLYAESCASCHGTNLEGQSNWKRRLDNGRMPAPPHDETGHTWHHADGGLFTVTKLGVSAVVPDYESDMPAFEGVLADEEIRAVLAFIKSRWPEQQRAIQTDITTKIDGGS